MTTTLKMPCTIRVFEATLALQNAGFVFYVSSHFFQQNTSSWGTMAASSLGKEAHVGAECARLKQNEAKVAHETPVILAVRIHLCKD